MVTPLNYFERLPKDIQKMLIRYIDSEDLFASAAASKVFQTLTNDNKVWIEVAQKYGIKLQNSNNAKKEILEITSDAHRLNVFALKAMQGEGYVVNWKTIFTDQPNPLHLTEALREKISNDKERNLNHVLDIINAVMIKQLPGLAIPVDSDPLLVHQKIIEHIRLNLEQLQLNSLKTLEKVNHVICISHYIGFEMLINYGIIGNNPNLSKKTNKEYWLEVLKISSKYLHQDSANIVFNAILNEFKKAALPFIEKLVILNQIYKGLPPQYQSVMDSFLTSFSLDETTLKAFIIHEYVEFSEIPKIFIQLSKLSNEQLLKIVNDAEAVVAKREYEKFKEEDDKALAVGNTPPCHLIQETFRSVKFESLRKSILSRVKGLD